MSGRNGDERAAAAETIAEALQAFVNERRALEADRDDWRARAVAAETQLAEQLAATDEERHALEADRDDWRARAVAAETQTAEQGEVAQPESPAVRRRARGNWLSDNRW